MYKVQSLFGSAATDDLWKDYYDLLQVLSREFGSDRVGGGWKRMRDRLESFRETNPTYDRWVVTDDSDPVAWANFRIHEDARGRNLGYIHMDSILDPVPEPVIRIVAETLKSKFAECESPLGYIMTASERISRVARAWGANEESVLYRYRLHRDDAKVELMREWLSTIPQRHPDIRIEFHDHIPDHLVERFCELYTRFIADMPSEKETEVEHSVSPEEWRRQAKWREKNKVQHYAYLMFNQDEMIGFTNAAIYAWGAKDIYQAMTGVLPEYRGKELGRWMKAALYLKLTEDFPENETVTTDMRSANDPILRLNASMGYKLVAKGGEFALKPTDLDEYLSGPPTA